MVKKNPLAALLLSYALFFKILMLNNFITEFCRKPVQKSAKKKSKGTLGDLKEKEKKDLKDKEWPKPILKIKSFLISPIYLKFNSHNP